MLRSAKTPLVVTVALWGYFGALGNINDWSETLEVVGAVTSKTTFDGGATTWQATSNPVVIWLGALFIMLSKIATALICTVGALKMWQTRKSDSANFAEAKKIALTGCAVALIMLFGGFIVIAETWFELWRSDVFRDQVLQSAFRYGGMITLIALFVAMKDE